MNSYLNFLFREKLYSCDICIDCSEDPTLIFMILNDPVLISEFGDEITIKTDFVKRLKRADDTEQLSTLRQSIFDALVFHPLYIEEKNRIRNKSNNKEKRILA